MKKPNKKQLKLTTVAALAFVSTVLMWMLIAGTLTGIGNQMHDPNDSDIDIQENYNEQTDTYNIEANSYYGEDIQLFAETDTGTISSESGDSVKISGLSSGSSVHVVKHSSSGQSKIIKDLIVGQ